MQTSGGGLRTVGLRAAGMLFCGTVVSTLAACSTSSDSNFSLFVDPAQYAYHDCKQIAEEIKTWTKKQQDLKALMDRADQSAGGAAVGFIAYKADYVTAGEELDLLHSTARNKKCDQDEAWRSSTVIR